jgi:hypothetical protein
MKNFADWAISLKAKAQLSRPVREMIRNGRRVFAQIFRIGVLVALIQSSSFAAVFSFERDTFAFQNATVLKYKNGVPFLRARSNSDDPANKYTRRCFVMTRTVMQFRKFARFDPHGAPLDDRQLAARVRTVAHRAPWRESLPENQRVVFPGYANLREMSKERAHVLQENIGSGFLTYFRPSNARMFFQHSHKYQERTHANLDAALTRGDLFVGYLSTYPKLSINHAVLFYGRKPSHSGSEIEHYLVYDPNHAEAPRELTWSPRERAFSYQKDIDFVGGFVRVYQAYGSWLE